jgi:pyruvate decarboxylase
LYQLEIAKRLTAAAVAITSPIDASHQIDYAIRTALREKKPAYNEIACNIAASPCAAPGPISGVVAEEPSDPESLEAAIEAAVEFLRSKRKPVLMIGRKLRVSGAEKEAIELAEALGCAVTVMAAAKSFFPDDHAQFAGIYLGELSTHQAREIVDWSDAVLFIGTVFNDYSIVGWTAMPTGSILVADSERVYLDGHDFARVRLRDFLSGLARKVEKREATMVEYKRIRSELLLDPPAAPDAKLTRTEIVRQIQGLVTSDSTIVAKTGDSWFNGIRLDRPAGARFEIEMQWGSIGWSVPATFGYAVDAQNRQIIAMIGDGSFQLTAQEVAQMIRRKLPVIIFLINNHGYTIEVEIHDGPYNDIKNWDYAGLIQAFNAEDGRGLGIRVSNGGELASAIKAAGASHDGPTLIECIIDRDDCSPELIARGRLVARANARPASPQ